MDKEQRCRVPVKRMLLWMFSLRVSLPLSQTVMKSKHPRYCPTKDGWSPLGMFNVDILHV